MERSVSYEEALIERLKDPDYAKKYLAIVQQEGRDTDAYLLALRRVEEAKRTVK